MNLLALDTSTTACVVGVRAGQGQSVQYEEQPREHTRILLPMIREALADAAISIADLDAIVLGNGPGSFIGLRIAASVAQGLAHGRGIGIVPVSSMASVAAAAGRAGDRVAVTQDAHMQQVYLGLYRISDDGLPVALTAERLQAQAPVAELTELDGVIAAGAGWGRYPMLLETNRGRLGRISGTLYPRADTLLTIGAAAFEAGGAVAPEAIEPAYLRRKVAQESSSVRP